MNSPFETLVYVTEGCETDRLVSLYRDPYISRVGHDHRPASPITHPQVTYLSAWVGNRFAGCFMFVRGNIDFDMHVLLYKWALPWSRKLGRSALDWAFSHPIERVTGLVIGSFKKSLNYGYRIGFSLEGIKRNACKQNGALMDVYMIGILRSEHELCR